VERPQLPAIADMVSELRASLRQAESAQRELLKNTGTAWSDDRLIKAVVGPRGQLLELEIDPRVYRTPNSTALAASIVATVQAAVEQVMAKVREMTQRAMPASVRELARDNGVEVAPTALKSDAELFKEMRDDV